MFGMTEFGGSRMPVAQDGTWASRSGREDVGLTMEESKGIQPRVREGQLQAVRLLPCLQPSKLRRAALHWSLPRPLHPSR